MSANRVANLFMIFAPLKGWRRVEVTDRHAAVDYAKVLKDLSDAHFPAAEKIVLVQDNLSTYTPASLYAAFPAPEARRLIERFEWHYTPKHGSWLDMAESELAVLTRQCLSRRTPDKQTLEKDAAAWERQPKQAPRQSRLAIHNSPRPRQTQKAVPSVRMTRATRKIGTSSKSASAARGRLAAGVMTEFAA